MDLERYITPSDMQPSKEEQLKNAIHYLGIAGNYFAENQVSRIPLNLILHKELAIPDDRYIDMSVWQMIKGGINGICRELIKEGKGDVVKRLYPSAPCLDDDLYKPFL